MKSYLSEYTHYIRLDNIIIIIKLPKCAQFVIGDVAIPHRNTSGCLAKIIPVAYPPYPFPQMPIRSLSMNFIVSLRYLYIKIVLYHTRTTCNQTMDKQCKLNFCNYNKTESWSWMSVIPIL